MCLPSMYKILQCISVCVYCDIRHRQSVKSGILWNAENEQEKYKMYTVPRYSIKYRTSSRQRKKLIQNNILIYHC